MREYYNIKAVSGIVGVNAASQFLASLSSQKILSGREILKDFNKYKKIIDTYKLHSLAAINEDIYRRLETDAVSYGDEKQTAKSLESYFDWLSENKKEAAAHFAKLYLSNTYPKAVGYMAQNCKILTMSLLLYVKSIK